jgi:methyl-accepting chemotaxis protein
MHTSYYKMKLLSFMVYSTNALLYVQAGDTARAVEEAATTAGQTVQAVQDTARQIPKAAPKTIKSVRKGAAKTRKTVNTTARSIDRLYYNVIFEIQNRSSIALRL